MYLNVVTVFYDLYNSRSSHWADDCYAKTRVDGSTIHDPPAKTIRSTSTGTVYSLSSFKLINNFD